MQDRDAIISLISLFLLLLTIWRNFMASSPLEMLSRSPLHVLYRLFFFLGVKSSHLICFHILFNKKDTHRWAILKYIFVLKKCTWSTFIPFYLITFWNTLSTNYSSTFMQNIKVLVSIINSSYHPKLRWYFLVSI